MSARIVHYDGPACKARFPLGRILVTLGARAALGGPPMGPWADARAIVCMILTRHAGGDWGLVPSAHARLNEEALVSGWALYSAYRLDGAGPILWVVTEGTRCVTTIMLPSEY